MALKLAGVRSVMGMDSGIEIAYHTVDCMLRHMIQHADGDDLDEWPVAVQMDFENGYNNSSLDKMCANVQKLFPELTAYTRLMYGTAGRLFCMSNGVLLDTVASVEGSWRPAGLLSF